MKFHLSQVYSALATCSPCEHSYVVDGRLTCSANPRGHQEIALFDPAFHCPLGKWKSKVDSPSQSFVATPSASMDLVQEQRTTWTKALEFLKSVGSVITHVGFVDDATLVKRLESCKACPRRMPKPDGDYCGACGCPEWSLAKLDNKLRLPYVTCPLKRPGFANEEGK